VRGDDGVAAGPLVSESGGEETALRPDGVGEPAERERKAGRRWARRRFAAGGPVLGPRGGGLARAEAGDSRGRLNSAGGLWVRYWGWEVVLRVRGFVRELLDSLNFSLDQRRGRERRGELTREGEDGGVPRIVLGRGEEGSGRGRCGEGGARSGLFIGARGKGSGGARRAPVRCTAPALMPHSAADETPRWGGIGQGRWSSGEDGAVPNSSCAARGRRWRGRR
jgi:hypothetical protein